MLEKIKKRNEPMGGFVTVLTWLLKYYLGSKCHWNQRIDVRYLKAGKMKQKCLVFTMQVHNLQLITLHQ